MVRVGAARQRFRGALLEPRLDREPFRAHLFEPQLMRPFAGDDDEVDAVGQERRPVAKAFAAETFHTVATHGAADLAGDDHP